MLSFHALYAYVNNYRATRPARTLRAPRRAFCRAVWHSDVFLMFDIINVNSFEHRTTINKNVLSYTEDGLKESRNVCKYR